MNDRGDYETHAGGGAGDHRGEYRDEQPHAGAGGAADDEHDYYETFSPRGSRRGRRGRGSAGGGRRRAADDAAYAPVGAGGDDGHDDDYYRDDHGDRPRRRGVTPLLVLLVVGALLVGGGFYGYGKLKDRLAPAPDYAGPGSGQVVFQVKQGDSVAAMGRGLAKKGVVKSVDAFLDAAGKDSRATGIQVGYYSLKKQMSAKGALDVLVDAKNLVQTMVLVPEGARVRDVVKTIVAKTDFTRAAVVRALEDTKALGLPAAARGNPEGYLFPATYVVTPDKTPASLLKEMVAKTVSVEQELDIKAGAKKLGLSVNDVLTVASILQYEANRGVDYPKVARVIYNRLDDGMALQLDSTVSYVSGRSGDVWTTATERDSDSAYNTYNNTGLPPGPIGSPGKQTIEAALNPADGNWLYFVPDFENNTTLFTDSYAEHLRNAEKAKEYCRTHESC